MDFLNIIYLGYLLNVLSFIVFYIIVAIILKKMKPNELLNFVKFFDKITEEKKEDKFMPSLGLYVIPYWGFYKLFIFLILNIKYLSNSSDAFFYILKKTTEYTNIFGKRKSEDS